jgi:hypothetical protein
LLLKALFWDGQIPQCVTANHIFSKPARGRNLEDKNDIEMLLQEWPKMLHLIQEKPEAIERAVMKNMSYRLKIATRQ